MKAAPRLAEMVMTMFVLLLVALARAMRSESIVTRKYDGDAVCRIRRGGGGLWDGG